MVLIKRRLYKLFEISLVLLFLHFNSILPTDVCAHPDANILTAEAGSVSNDTNAPAASNPWLGASNSNPSSPPNQPDANLLRNTTATKIKEDFPELPSPRKTYIKENFPVLPNPQKHNHHHKHDPSTDSKSLATDDELAALSEALYQQDNSQLKYITLDLQGKTSSSGTTDEAPNPLLKVQEQIWDSPTIAKMRLLFNNYELDTTINEQVTPAEMNEENEFLDLVMATPVMQQAMGFLQSKGIVTPDPNSHRELIKSLWFTLYGRARSNGKIGSSAFEHVFLAEARNTTVLGLHNWIYYYEEEKAKHIDYKGYFKKVDLGKKATIVSFRFTHNGLKKPFNTLLFGTTPELELALYTVCFKLRTNKDCPVSMDGNKFWIVTHSYKSRGKTLIGSAYFKI